MEHEVKRRISEVGHYVLEGICKHFRGLKQIVHVCVCVCVCVCIVHVCGGEGVGGIACMCFVSWVCGSNFRIVLDDFCLKIS